jgi:biotin operon repressor
MSAHKEVRQFIDRLEEAGCEVTPRRNGHYKVVGPNGAQFTLPKSPSASNWRQKAACQLRQRLGVDVR